MEDLGDIGNSGESSLEETDTLVAMATNEEQLSLGDISMVYKAHAAVGAAIFVEGLQQPLHFSPRQPLPLDSISLDSRGETLSSQIFSSLPCENKI